MKNGELKEKMIDSDKLIKFFEAEYYEELEADEIKKGISDDMKSFAENNEVSPKSIKSAYSLYKKFKSGKSTSEECSDYAEMSNIIENYFASEDNNKD